MPLGAEKTTLMGAAGGSDANYFGDGSDGALTTSGNVTHTVSNTSTYDGDMVVKNYTTLTISAGHTMTVNNKCKGLLIFVTGDCTINGTIDMTDKGASYSGTYNNNPISGSGTSIWYPMFTASAGSQNLTVAAADFSNAGSAATTAVANQPGIAGNGTLFSMSGGAGGGRGGPACNTANDPGDAGSGGTRTSSSYEMWVLTGGGGGGGASHDGSGCSNGGHSGAGTPFSGGSGGGGGAAYHTSKTGGSASNTAGAGGTGAWHSQHNVAGAGGAGNPGGGGGKHAGGTYSPGDTGNGGCIWLIVGGNLTLGSSSHIKANGSNGGGAGGYVSAGGGGSGGGACQIMYAGTLTNSGCTFGFAGGGGGGGAGPGGAGGTGGHLLTQVTAA